METISAYWTEQILKIEKDLSEKPVSNFQQWDSIRSNMVVLWSDKTDAELGDIKSVIPQRVIATPEFGGPNRTKLNGLLVSANTIHMLYHWMQWGSFSGIGRIVEFGGGFGEMYRLARSLGFAGEYVIYDLPVMNTIQNIYLGGIGDNGCRIISDVNDLPSKADLIVSMSALSEMPYGFRNELLAAVCTKGLLLSFSDDLGYNNSKWFGDMASLHPELVCEFWDHPYRKLKYMIGRANAGIRLSGRIQPSDFSCSPDDGKPGCDMRGVREEDAQGSATVPGELERSSAESRGNASRDSGTHKKRGPKPGKTFGT